ncbi:MAG TPA: hypothetical protein VJ937_08660 [Salinivirga sp.]|uniref:hypothetical protein n=1 Tax=Salinivirga sp. TaxID=1970192 RepID=UPI002B49F615|nr:hypothetical protein [Salinivirga sp.]HKK59534.1 hypothetical protein [Salinivirga sp.]
MKTDEKDRSQQNVEEPVTKPEEQQPTKEEKQPDKAFNEIWSSIVETLKDDGPRINAAIQQAKPQQLADNKILIHIGAESHKDLYKKFAHKIIDVLRQQMNNKDLSFEFKQVENEIESKRPLTNAEKYKKLSEHNPALEALRKKFNLDIKNNN